MCSGVSDEDAVEGIGTIRIEMRETSQLNYFKLVANYFRYNC